MDESLRPAILHPIEEQILRATGNHFERLVLLAADGRVLATYDGGPTDLVVPAADVARFGGRVALITHNHPGSRPPTIDDLLGTIALAAPEIDAFGLTIRYRLLLAGSSDSWPDVATARDQLIALRRGVQQVVAPHVRRGAVPAAYAETLIRHRLWQLFAQQSGGRIHYVVEAR